MLSGTRKIKKFLNNDYLQIKIHERVEKRMQDDINLSPYDNAYPIKFEDRDFSSIMKTTKNSLKEEKCLAEEYHRSYHLRLMQLGSNTLISQIRVLAPKKCAQITDSLWPTFS